MSDEKKAADKSDEKVDESKALEEKQKEAAANLSKQVATAVATELKPVFETLSGTMKTIGESFAAMVAKSADEKLAGKAADEEVEDKEDEGEVEKAAAKKADEDEKKKKDAEAEKKAGDDEEKPAEKEADKLEDVQKTLATLTDKLIEVAKSVEVLGKATPPEMVRDEKVETEKSADKDPNNCLDSLFPFAYDS